VFHEAESNGYKSDNGTWNGIVELVRSGITGIAAAPLAVTKERYEVVAFTDTIGVTR
jgi:ABC-type amino acid transport substrate-binding protein